MKRLLCLVMSVLFIVCSALSAAAEAPVPVEMAVSEISQQDYLLSWESIGARNVPSSVSVGADKYTYTYNGRGNRLTKKSYNSEASYEYDQESCLLSEIRDGKRFEYLYDSMYTCIGFIYNNNTYYFVKGDDFNVVAITDEHHNYIAKYKYGSDGIVSAILGKDEYDNWVDKSQDTEFIGTLNLIRLHSYYFDAETGWYYNSLQYYDSNNNQYIVNSNFRNNSIVLEDFARNIVPMAVPTYLIQQISNWSNSLINDPNFGRGISYSYGWYNNLSDVEILTRLLYGENTTNSADQNAVAWVIINRRNNGSFGSTYRSIAIAPSQFEPMTGNSDGTQNARMPNTGSPRWKNAVWSACTLLSTLSTTDYEELIFRPSGISTQLYFVGLNYFFSSFTNGNPVSKDTVPVGTGLTYSYDSGRTYKKIKDVVIVFDIGDVLQNPSSKGIILGNTKLDTLEERRNHNIFYNYQ